MRSSGPSFRRGGIIGELALAIPPTLVVIGVIFLIDGVTKQKLLFATLAASAFLIYYDPMNRVNSLRVMIVAQLLAFVLGIAAAMAVGPGFVAGGIAMFATIFSLILLDVVHPPAVSTALAFAFVSMHSGVLLVFLVALVLIGALVLLQRVAILTLGRIERSIVYLEHEAVEKIEHVYAEHRHRARVSDTTTEGQAPGAETDSAALGR
jgi:CBS-domain-containing membrane protein